MGKFLTNRELLSIHSESVPRRRSKANTYSSTSKKSKLCLYNRHGIKLDMTKFKIRLDKSKATIHSTSPNYFPSLNKNL